VTLAAEHDFGARDQAAGDGLRPSTPSSPMPTMDSQRFGEAGSGMVRSARTSRILILAARSRRAACRRARQAPGVTVTLSLAAAPRSPCRSRSRCASAVSAAPRLGRYLAKSDRCADRRDTSLRRDHLGQRGRGWRATGVPLVALRRKAWTKVDGDSWVEVATMDEAVRALGQAPRRVFLALGRKELQPFTAAPQHVYLIRSVDPVDPPLAVPHAIYIAARGLFSEAEDRALLKRHRIDVVVAKNSGGSATYGKIAAARTLQLPVIMLARPALPEVSSVATVEEALVWLDHAIASSTARGV
jgi:precorrin-6A/cobalt-precorrin-6A reductase